MKKRTKIFYYNVALLLLVLLLVGCTGDTNAETETDSSEDDAAVESEEETDETDEDGVESDAATESEEASSGDFNDTASEETGNEGSTNTYGSEENALADYSSEEIEYARVWLQLGPNQELDELNVRHISAGTPLNPDDETSAGYPEGVIQLAGSRLADGSVTYSGNGDGTINVYSVPLRWDGQYPAGEEFYKDMIENTMLDYVDPGDDEEIIELIDIMTIQ